MSQVHNFNGRDIDSNATYRPISVARGFWARWFYGGELCLLAGKVISSIIPYMPLTPALRASKRVELRPRRLGIDSIEMFGRYNNTIARDELLEHSHGDALEICYLVRGRQTYSLGGQDFHLRGGDVFISFPGEIHGTGGAPQEKGILYWIIVLNPSATGGSLLGLHQSESRVLWREIKKKSHRHFHGTPGMKVQLDEILQLFHQAGHGLMKKTALCNRIVAFLLDVLDARARSSAGMGAGRFAEVIHHMRSHLDDPDQLTMDVLSSVAGLSPSRFKALFKEMWGIPPAEYALRLRIAEARRRLVESGATVTQVATDLGFSSSQYFATSFKRLMNMTPREAARRGGLCRLDSGI